MEVRTIQILIFQIIKFKFDQLQLILFILLSVSKESQKLRSLEVISVRGNLVISNGDISLGDIVFSDGDLI